MIINVGSVNPTKLQAVREVISQYDLFKEAEVIGVKVSSNVSDQPRTIDETVVGARNRAKKAFNSCDYSIGLEAGLFCVPESIPPLRWMNFTAVVIYDGQHYAVGFSPAFEIPPKMAKFIAQEGCEMDEAVHRMGLSSNNRVGYGEGLIGILTQGLVTRKDYMKPAIQMALAQLQSRDLYF